MTKVKEENINLEKYKNKFVLIPSSIRRNGIVQELYRSTKNKQTVLFNNDTINDIITINTRELFSKELYDENNRIAKIVKDSKVIEKIIEKYYEGPLRIKNKSLFFREFPSSSSKFFEYITQDKDLLSECITEFSYKYDNFMEGRNFSISDANEECFKLDMEEGKRISRRREFPNLYKEEILKCILNTSIESNGSKPLYYYVILYLKNQQQMDGDESKKKFEGSIIAKFKELGNIDLLFDRGELFIESEDGKHKVKKVLSISEKKTLAYVIIENKIHYEFVKYVIIEDPVENYDGHFRLEMTNYISTIIGIEQANFTIFTSSSNFCHCVVNKNRINNKFKVIFFYQNPKFKIKTMSKLYDYDEDELINVKVFDVSKLINLNRNELFILKDLLKIRKDGKNNDDLFIMLSMFLSIRGLVNNINKEIQRVNYPVRITNSNLSIKDDVALIEETYLHYSNKYVKNGQNIVEKLRNVHIDLIENKNIYSVSKKYKCINNCEVRKQYLAKKLDEIDIDNFMYKIILFKMLRLQECKYKIEKRMCDLLEKYIDITDIINEKHGLGSKIKVAKKIPSSTNKAKVKKIIKEVEDIYQKYRTLINDYSHGIEKMFPPYLDLDVVEMARLECEIDNLQ